MSQVDPTIYRRRRLLALVVLALVISLIWGVPQLLGGGQPAASPSPTPTPSSASVSAEVTNCQPGVVEVEAFIGREANQEALVNIPAGEPVFLWYEIINTSGVDCIFDIGTYATFFTISSGDQVYYSSRQCDRGGDSKNPMVLPANEIMKSSPGEWLKVYSSDEFQCDERNELVPTGGASYDIQVEVSGVVSEKKRFYLF